MIFKRLEIDNLGPITQLCVEFPKDGQRPKPLIIVGENGSGKSILLSHLVNALIIGKQEVYEDVEVDKGRLFKFLDPLYIKSGEAYSFSKVECESGDTVFEWQLVVPKNAFENKLRYTPFRKEWTQIPTLETSHIQHSFQKNNVATKEIFSQQCCLYFPVNRFEEPAWLNLMNLKARAEYSELNRTLGYSNREIVCISPLKKNMNWLLDLIFDRQLNELKSSYGEVKDHFTQIQTLQDDFGPCTTLYNSVHEVVKIILRESGNIQLGFNSRKNRQIAVMKDEKVWVPNLFQLSTGEVQLINLFLSIIRDYDLSEGKLESLTDIKGTVIIDEIDTHLHASHQKDVLPKLIQLFPNVQFIVTTHSPLFLLGMETLFGSNGFEIIEMPNGARVSAGDYSEFVAVYEAFKETKRYQEEIKCEIEKSTKPMIFVEGDYDIRYLEKAAQLRQKTHLLQQVQLKDGGGFGNLDKTWNYFKDNHTVLTNKMILLYDCDTKRQNENKGRVFRRLLPPQNNPIEKGIENLFSSSTIDRLEKANPQFIDHQGATINMVRGVPKNIPALKSINKDEKNNVCDWLCKNGTAQDFSSFDLVFEIIEDIINLP